MKQLKLDLKAIYDKHGLEFLSNHIDCQLTYGEYVSLGNSFIKEEDQDPDCIMCEIVDSLEFITHNLIKEWSE